MRRGSTGKRNLCASLSDVTVSDGQASQTISVSCELTSRLLGWWSLASLSTGTVGVAESPGRQQAGVRVIIANLTHV